MLSHGLGSILPAETHDLTKGIRVKRLRQFSRDPCRDTEVADKLDALRPQTLVDDSAAQEYQVLTLDKAKLAQVIGFARKHLRS